MRVRDFDYHLPEELIAQHPAPQRRQSRMLTLYRHGGVCRLTQFERLPDYLAPGDCLVLNDTRVIPARLFGRKDSGGRVEAMLLNPVGDDWQALLRPGRRLRPGTRVHLEGSPEHWFEVRAREPDGVFRIAFSTAAVLPLLDAAGQVPLPPYIRRDPTAADRERYQTVYAARPGAVAAPTAGLHFDAAMLATLQRLGVRLAPVTLHVGAGTFRPVESEDLAGHRMHSEYYELGTASAAAINAARAAGRRVFAVGTTCVRVLETCAAADGAVTPGRGWTEIFLHPPYRPRAVDGLLTNFHLPRSTLLMLICTFAPRHAVLAAYRLAVANRLRFYSYGDCMLLAPPPTF